MKQIVPKWDTLRIIGKSRLISLTILVPFIGYLILFNNELVSYFELSKEVMNLPETDKSISGGTITRLYYLYYGLTIIGISSIAFSFLCPNIVKNYRTEYEFSESEIKIMTGIRFGMLVSPFRQILEKESQEYKDLEGYVSAYNGSWDTAEKIRSEFGHESVVIKNKEIEASSFLNVLSFIWGYYIDSKLYVRALITLGYSVGFLLVLYPSLQVFLKVCKIILIGSY